MSREEPVLISQPIYKPMILQSIEDFEREQDTLDAERTKAKPITQPLPKKAKRSIDPEALAAEKRARDELGEVNWVGRLLEYRNAHPVAIPAGHAGGPPGLDYKEATIEKGIVRFAFTVKIAESPQSFGGEALSFSNKKDAKKYAAKKAIDWLIANQHMPSDGSVKFPKAPTRIQAQPKKRKSVSPSESDTPTDGTPPVKYTTKVPALCTKLGFPPPKYEITRAKADDHSFWHGYADFNDPRIEGKVGRVFNVWGQKNAKEQCAEIVYSFLKDIEKQRGEEFGAEDRKRKRSSESPGDRKEAEENKGGEAGTDSVVNTHA